MARKSDYNYFDAFANLSKFSYKLAVSLHETLSNFDASKITEEVKAALSLLDIDDLGLDSMDRKILNVMKNYYQGGPVGIDALSATLGEDKQTIEEVYEPYLLKQGLILRTPRGRLLSENAISHIS